MVEGKYDVWLGSRSWLDVKLCWADDWFEKDCTDEKEGEAESGKRGN